MREKHPEVAWPIEYLHLRRDDIYLSPAYERDSVTLSLHQSPDLPYQEFFADAEAVFRQSRRTSAPGASCTIMTTADLRACYPMWDRFQEQRARVDPQGRFLRPYLHRLMLAE